MVWISKCIWLAKVQTCAFDSPMIDTGQSNGHGVSHLAGLVYKNTTGKASIAISFMAHNRPCRCPKVSQGHDGPLDAPSFEARHRALVSSFRPGCRFDGENSIFDTHVMNQPPLHPTMKAL